MFGGYSTTTISIMHTASLIATGNVEDTEIGSRCRVHTPVHRMDREELNLRLSISHLVLSVD